jgi:5-methylcytosine-specific restriction endonuclease McrA
MCGPCYSKKARPPRTAEYRERRKRMDAEKWARCPRVRTAVQRKRKRETDIALMAIPEKAARKKVMFSAWYAANAERNRQKGVAWRAANRERRRKTYAAWCVANPDSKRRKNRAWARAHLEVARTNCSLRRARERGNGGSHSSTEFRMLCVVSGWLCRYCGIKIEPKGRGYLAPVRDHVEPLARGGSNAISNLVLSCFPCNLRKGNFSLAEFLERRARSAKNGTRAGA